MLKTITHFFKTGYDEMYFKYADFKGVSSRYEYWAYKAAHLSISFLY